MQRTTKARRLRMLAVLAVTAFFSTAGAVWGDTVGVTVWPWTEFVDEPDVKTVRDTDDVILGDGPSQITAMDLPAGRYHVSGKISIENTTSFDRDLSCTVYAQAENDDAAAVDSTSLGAKLQSGQRFVGGYSGLFELHDAGRVWSQCTGDDTGQPPYNGEEEKSWPEYPSVYVHLTATPVDDLP